MKPPRKRLTVRALMVVTALFAVDFAGNAWVARHGGPGLGIIAPILLVFAPFVLLFALIYFYVPRNLEEVCYTILILVTLIMLLLPVVHD